MSCPASHRREASIAAVQPAPIVTTSTFRCVFAISAPLAAGDREDRTVRGVARVHGRQLLEPLHPAWKWPRSNLFGCPRPLRARVADQLPPGEFRVPAVDRVGEHPLVRVVL